MMLSWKKWYGHVGLAAIVIMLLVAYFRIPHINLWVTPVAWYGYILFMDSLVYKRKKTSLLTANIKEFLIMLPISVGLWLIFEWHNRSFYNWQYQGSPRSIALAIFGILSFATILPGIYETSAFLKTRGFLNIEVPAHVYRKRRLILEIIMGLMLIATATFFPSTYTGPLIWPGYLFVFAPLNYLIGAPSMLKQREHGRLSGFFDLLAAGYICGFVWEFLNFWAGAKWVYNVPYFQDVKFFEMPIMGLLGFGPFAIAFVEMYRFVKFLPTLAKKSFTA